MRKMLTSAILGGLVFLLAGCPNPPVTPEKPPVGERDTTSGPAGGSGAQTNPVDRDKLNGTVDGDVTTGQLAKRSIYFEFDKYDIQDQYKPVVEAHAHYLVSRPGRKILIQGNCDERGSRE